jgi:hypothetical protein
MPLKYEDLICLSRADLEAKKIDYGNRLITVDTESMLRLEEEGCCDAKGNLTEKGIGLVEKLEVKVKKLRRGVPLESRKRVDPHRVGESPGPWLTGEYRKRPYLSDGYFFMYAKPYAAMNSKKGSGDFRKHVPTMLSKILAMKDIQDLSPTYWQLQVLGGLEVIWLMDLEKSMLVPLNAMYYDFIMNRYPTSQFYGVAKVGTPIQIQVKNRGVPQDVVGVVMPLDLEKAVEETMWATMMKETEDAAE